VKVIFPLFLDNTRRHSLIKQGDTILVGFSGGKDSVTLLLLLNELQKEMPIHLIAAYFNHHLRFDSDREAQWVTQFCSHHEIELVKGERFVRDRQKEDKMNLEHVASLSRYEFFEHVAQEHTNARIATAHTRSDLSETFFIKLFRGSGLQGLSAIYQNKGKKLIRPLLIFNTKDILEFLDRNQIEYYEDYSNHDDAFLRNRLRHKLMPILTELEPHIDERIFRTTQLIQDEFEYFQETARQFLEKTLILGRILPTVDFEEVPKALQRHISREYIRLLKGNLLNIGIEHIESFIDTDTGGKGLPIPGIHLHREKGYIYPPDVDIPSYHYLMPEPKSYALTQIGMTLRMRTVHTFTLPKNNREIIIPTERLLFPLYLRSPERGDKYRKINAPYAQNLFEIIRASGTPAVLRNLCPVLANGNGEIIWCLNSPVSHAFRISKDTPPPYIHIVIQTGTLSTGTSKSG